MTTLQVVEHALGVPMMTREEMLAVLGAPGADWFAVKVGDVVLAPAACVHLHGKGRKQR